MKNKKASVSGRKRKELLISFDQKKETTLLKRVRPKHAFEDTQKAKDKSDKLAQIWDEDLCE